MNKKETSINEKLFNLQQEIGTVSKDATNPFYKSKYFDINSLIKQLQPLLKKHRLLLLQPIEEDMVVSKLLCIDGGGGVVSGLKLPEITDPQKILACITYYRRGTLTSLLGLQAEDDDGNTANGNTTQLAEKSWLNKDTLQFTKVINHLKQGGNIKDVEAKYKISKAVKDELLKL